MNKLNLRTSRLAMGLGLFLLLQLPATFGVAADAGDAAARVERLATMLQEREGDRFWSLVSRIEEIGEAAVPALKARLSADNEKTRLGCAKALLGLGDTNARSEALGVLGNLAAKSGTKEVRIDAIRVYGLVADPDEIIDRFCILGDEAAHIQRLRELEALGVDQFAIYLMHDQQDETLDAYGRGIVSAMSD